MARKLRGLFLNSPKGQCSIYESGLMAFEAIRNSESFSLDYSEVRKDARKIPADYDFYLFNYHPWTMAWLDTESIKKLPGLKLTFVLETLPNNPFPLVPGDLFDVYLPMDPTIPHEKGRIYPLPRPVEKVLHTNVKEEDVPERPIIGTFGFGTPGKGFELVVDAVNREFDRALIRINVPRGDFSEKTGVIFQGGNYAEYLEELCRKVAKPGIEIEFTRHYFNKEELIRWCSENTLNCFLYNRRQPGLAATTDQAISSGRPVAVSSNPTFRHIHQYVEPYPFRSLRDSIRSSGKEVAALQKAWNRESFAGKVSEAIEENRNRILAAVAVRPSVRYVKFAKLPIRIKPRIVDGWAKLKIAVIHRVDATEKGRRLRELARKLKEKSFGKRPLPPVVHSDPKIGNEKGGVLIVSHAQKQCGIFQFGMNVSRALRASKKFSYVHRTVADEGELLRTVTELEPRAIIYNYYPFTMPWLTTSTTRKIDLPQIGVIHEVTQTVADEATDEMFDYHLAPDPSLKTRNPIVFPTPRLIPEYCNYLPLPKTPRIGSFGFGFGTKGFERVVEAVQKEYDEALIVLHMPANDVVDPDGMIHAIHTAYRCRSLVKKPKIFLEIHHDFLPLESLLDSLAMNTANIFLYDVDLHKGISSTIEHALAAQRPLIVNHCGMFRHVHDVKPSICIEDRSIREIIETGIAPLVPKYSEWSPARFVMAYDGIVEEIFKRESKRRARTAGFQDSESLGRG